MHNKNGGLVGTSKHNIILLITYNLNNLYNLTKDKNSQIRNYNKIKSLHSFSFFPR